MTTVPAHFGIADARVKLRVLNLVRERLRTATAYAPRFNSQHTDIEILTADYRRRLALALEAERTHFRTIKSTYQPPTP